MSELEYDFSKNNKEISSITINQYVPVASTKKPKNKKSEEKQYEVVEVKVDVPAIKSDSEMSEGNMKILDWIDDNEDLANYEWMKETRCVHSIENPYNTEIMFLNQCNTIKLYSENCNICQLPDNMVDKREKLIPGNRNLTFMNEIASADKYEKKDNLRGHSLSSYFLGNDEFEERNKMILSPPPTLPPIKFISFKLKGFSSSNTLLVPIQISAKLLSEKKYISEEWTFYPKDDVSIYEKQFPSFVFSTKENASFEVPDLTKKVYFVIIISHILCVDGSNTLVDYYLTGNTQKAKKSVSTTWPRNHDVFTPFGFAFVDLESIIEKKELIFEKVFPLNQHPTSLNINQLIENAIKKKSEPNIEMKFIFGVQQDESAFPEHDIASKNVSIVRLFQEPSKMIYPRIRLTHVIRINLLHAYFKLPSKVKGKNIFAILSIRNDLSSDPLKLHYSRLVNEKDYEGMSKCYYHVDKGIFDEIFSFNLPFPMNENISLCFEFYHLIAKKCDNNIDRQYIGCSYIKLLNKELNRIQDGVHKIPIYYQKLSEIKSNVKNKTDNSNCVAIDIKFDSTLIFANEEMAKFAKNCDPNDVLNITKDDLCENLYLVLDILVDQLIYKPKEAILGLVSVVEKVKETFKEKTYEYLDTYASTFSLRSPTKKYHLNLMNEWAGYMDTFKDNEERLDNDLQHFFFVIIIKSIILSGIGVNEPNFLNSRVFSRFCVSFTQSIMRLKEPKDSIIQYSNFLVALFNANYCNQVIFALLFQIDTMLACNSSYIELFLREVLKPKLLYCSIMKIPSFINGFIKKYIKLKTSVPFIYTLLIDLFSLYPINIQHNIGMKLIELISEMSPLQWNKLNIFDSEKIFFIFLVENVQYSEKSIKWWKSSDKDSIILSFNSLIDNINISSNSTGNEQLRNKEIAFSVNCAIVNFIKFLQNDKESINYTTSIIYSLISSNQKLEVGIYKKVLKILTNLTMDDISYFINNSYPPSQVLFKCLLLQSSKTKMISKYFYKTLKEEYRLIAPSLYRALSQLTSDELNKVKLISFDDEQNDNYNMLLKTIPEIIEIEKQLYKSNISLEEINILLLDKINLLSPSPDSIIELLLKLEKYLNEQGYFAELLQTRISQVAIILECLTLQKRIPAIFNTIHPSTVFKGICNFHEFIKQDSDEYIQVSGFCDSKYFNICSLNSLLYDIISKSFKSKQYEVALMLVNIAWPIFEYTRSYGLASKLMKMEKGIIDVSLKMPDRVFGTFFKVSYYGKCFGKLYDGNSFIYHEKSMIHLYDFSNELIDKWKGNCPETAIELIKEKGEIDKSNLEPSKGYIQIVYVEPYFTKKEKTERSTLFYKNNFIQKFFIDIPFLKDSKKTQGNIDEQWIRRIIINVKYPMPYIIKVQKVLNNEIKEFLPIKVSYKQLNERLVQFDNAIQESDFLNIQQLLHGTLLVQVNAGPTKIAELFLSNRSEDPEYTKYQAKLRNSFKAMETKIQTALEMHRKWVFQGQPIFKPLQEQLESGFKDFKDKLSNYY